MARSGRNTEWYDKPTLSFWFLCVCGMFTYTVHVAAFNECFEIYWITNFYKLVLVTLCSTGGLCVNHCQKVWNCFGGGCGWSWRRDSITSNNSQVSLSSMNCLRNRKHAPCFYCITVQVEVWENKKMLQEHELTGKCLCSFYEFFQTSTSVIQ